MRYWLQARAHVAALNGRSAGKAREVSDEMIDQLLEPVP